MNKHEHNDCEHDLKYCKVCRVVYCLKCDLEWVLKNLYYPKIWYDTNVSYQGDKMEDCHPKIELDR